MAYKLYKGSTLIKKVYYGSTPIKKIYKGSQLIWQADPYPPGTVFINLTNNVGSEQFISLEEGIYYIECIGAGSAGNGAFAGSLGYIMYGAGGSGSGFVGNFYLPKATYKYNCGNGGNPNGGEGQSTYILRTNDSVGIYANGGEGGSYTKSEGNNGGVLNINSSWIRGTPQVNRNGNKGNNGALSISPSSGGASIYNGFGSGGNSTGSGNNGFLKVTYIGQ